MTSQTYRALLIANSTFPNDQSNLPDLEGPRNDLAVLRDALCDRQVGLFTADNVRLVGERTMAEVLGEIEDFLRSAARQDTLLLYYSGHGMLDLTNELFFCTRDTRSDRLRSTAVKASDLRAMMDESAVDATVVVLDCCHSGRFKGGDIPTALAGSGRFVMTSSRGTELAQDAHTRNHASFFTHYLADGLLRGAKDHNADGFITVSELYDYIHGALVAERRQRPQKRFSGDGDVVIALRPTPAIPHPSLPGLIDPAAAAPILDLSESQLDLGEITADETLPPERIAVINRGGGTLDWTVESSAKWVAPVPEEGAIMLHLRPEPGPNRANVYVRETQTGTLKTVRVRIRVRQPDRESAGAAPPSDHNAERPPQVPSRTTLDADQAPTQTAPPLSQTVSPVRPSVPRSADVESDRTEGAVLQPPMPPPPSGFRPVTVPGAGHPPTSPRRRPLHTTGQILKRQWRAIARRRWAVRSLWVWASMTVAFLCIAVPYIVYTEVQEGRIVNRLEANGERVDGEVVATNGSVSYRVVFNDGHQNRSETLMAGGNSPDYKPGDKVTVLVDSENPEHVAVKGDTNYAKSLRSPLLNAMYGVLAPILFAVMYVGGVLVWACFVRR